MDLLRANPITNRIPFCVKKRIDSNQNVNVAVYHKLCRFYIHKLAQMSYMYIIAILSYISYPVSNRYRYELFVLHTA